jgi:hypothetical protein
VSTPRAATPEAPDRARTPPASQAPPGGLPAWVLPAALLALGAVIAGATMRDGIQPNDEGLMLQAAAHIADGQVPIRDFWWYYPPGQPYLLGGLWALFGPSLLAWRVVRVGADALVALLAWRLARRWSSPGWALGAWAASALAMAYPTGPHPFPIALACALGALLALPRQVAWAGVLAGLCALWRLEFAGYLVVGILAAIALAPDSARARRRRAVTFFVPALGVTAVLYAPVVAAAGPGPSWRLLVRYPLTRFQAYQGLPFPLTSPPRVDTGSVAHFLGHSAENLLLYYLPLALVVGAAAALTRLALGFTRARAGQLAGAVLTIGMGHYMVVRPDVFHTAPLAVMASILIGWALSRPAAKRRGDVGAADGAPATASPPEPGPARVPAVAAGALAALAAVSLAYTVIEGADRQRLLLKPRETALRLPAADGVRAPPEVAGPLVAAVHAVDARVPRGQPIYVTGRRADLVTAGDPLFYVLADRPNPTRYDIAAPGVVTTAPVQREIVATLERRRVAVVVRWDDPLTAAPEPNRAGRSSGVRILDEYLGAHYRAWARYGSYMLLARVDDPGLIRRGLAQRRPSTGV